MANPPRKIGFVLAATEHGTMILNRFDLPGLTHPVASI
jgi:hypothetical protein